MATTTPNYGWDVPTSTDYVKDGATAIETLGDEIDSTLYTALGGAYPGLRLVKKQTIGSGVASVQVTDAFSATYENYLIILSGGTASSATGINLTLGATVTGYYRGGNFTSYASATVTGVTGSNVTNWGSVGVASTTSLDTRIELYEPFVAKNTKFRASYASALTNGESLVQGGFLNNTLSYTDFTLTKATSGTMTGGTIYVYGYGVS
jgi:hypothetical protein